MPSALMKKRSRLASLAAAAQASAARRPDVAIEASQQWVVRSSPTATARLVIAIRATGGLTGYGETTAGSDPDTAAQQASRYTKLLSGQDALATISTMGALGSAPASIRGAVDIALLDLKGKLAGAAIYDLLAGRTRDKARAMAALSGNDEAALLKALAAARGDGYRSFSVPILLPEGIPTRGRKFFDETESLLGRLRKAGADDLVLDCGGRTTASEAAGLAARLEEFHLMWMDEPATDINNEALKKISHETVTPVGWGRGFTSNAQFQDLLRLQVIDVVRPDIGLTGITAARKAAALAEAYYTGIAPFHRGGPIGAAAALHVAASVPNFVAQELAFTIDERERRMNAEIASGTGFDVSDGFIELPT